MRKLPFCRREWRADRDGDQQQASTLPLVAVLRLAGVLDQHDRDAGSGREQSRQPRPTPHPGKRERLRRWPDEAGSCRRCRQHLIGVGSAQGAIELARAPEEAQTEVKGELDAQRRRGHVEQVPTNPVRVQGCELREAPHEQDHVDPDERRREAAAPGAQRNEEQDGELPDARDRFVASVNRISPAAARLAAQAEKRCRAGRPLVASRWSLLDDFDTDGRRFVVAVENSPPTRPPRTDLSEREHQVMTQAHLGHTDKPEPAPKFASIGKTSPKRRLMPTRCTGTASRWTSVPSSFGV